MNVARGRSACAGLEAKADVLQQRQVGKQSARLWDVADPPLMGGSPSPGRAVEPGFTVDHDGALCGTDQARERPERQRLSCPRWTKEREDTDRSFQVQVQLKLLAEAPLFEPNGQGDVEVYAHRPLSLAVSLLDAYTTITDTATITIT